MQWRLPSFCRHPAARCQWVWRARQAWQAHCRPAAAQSAGCCARCLRQTPATTRRPRVLRPLPARRRGSRCRGRRGAGARGSFGCGRPRWRWACGRPAAQSTSRTHGRRLRAPGRPWTRNAGTARRG
ncbi:hypothetical protein [Acidovorax sp. BL-A-41-H1]|uniref:hypothetical protein n=1 Tax=Acidovorax sp. BL-A-41-H1 TaxID=3421102 RepID=UPI003F7B03A3